MNETRRLTLILFSVGITALMASSAAAVEGGDGGRGPHGMRDGHGPPLDRILERHSERLGLDDAARERVAAIADESREASDDIHERMRELHEKLRTALDADEPDEDRVMQLAEEIGQVRIEGNKQRLRTMLRIRAELTPEQRAELVKIREERKERRGEHGGPGTHRRHHRERHGEPGRSPSDEAL
jgi:Spy/CpxP family protein refolding chaperone